MVDLATWISRALRGASGALRSGRVGNAFDRLLGPGKPSIAGAITLTLFGGAKELRDPGAIGEIGNAG